MPKFLGITDVYVSSFDAKAIQFHCVGLKGDLKFLVQSLNLTRHPGKEEALGLLKFC